MSVGITESERGKSFTAPQQAKSLPGRSLSNFDSSPDNEKQPSANKGKAQRIANTGETIPIVFGKRSSNKGGIWVQPPLVKSGSTNFKGQFLYVISQGQISSSPSKIKTWVGLRNMAFLDDQTITIAHNYSTAASLTSSSGTCPIAGSGLYCGIETYTYRQVLIKATVNEKIVVRPPDYLDEYYNFREIVRGTGDTTQITFTATYEVYDNETGADITTAYNNWLGGGGATLGFNQRYDSSGAVIGGNAVGTITDWVQEFIDDGLDPLTDPLGLGDSDFLDVSGGRSDFSYRYTITAVNNPTYGSTASTGTLDGVQREYIVSNTADPNSTPTADNSSYADITFLQVNGDIYTPPSAGSYPSTTEQLYLFYDEGVKVDLYSAGLSSGSYTNAASNQFIDLAMYLFRSYKQTAGATTSDIAQPVYLTNLQALSSFCTNYSFAFNGVIDQSVNIVEYISNLAPFFLLSFLNISGQFRFASVLPLNGSNQIDVTALSPKMTFTEANIIGGSFEKGYLSVEDRREFIANLVYRDSRPAEIGSVKTVSVRYTATAIDAPTEQYDLSSFCIDPTHASTYAKYELAKRKYSTHNIKFDTPLLTTELIPTDVIKITRQRRSSTDHADRSETEWYQVTNVSHSAEGFTSIEASHFPVNDSSVSLISNEVVNGTFKVLS